MARRPSITLRRTSTSGGVRAAARTRTGARWPAGPRPAPGPRSGAAAAWPRSPRADCGCRQTATMSRRSKASGVERWPAPPRSRRPASPRASAALGGDPARGEQERPDGRARSAPVRSTRRVRRIAGTAVRARSVRPPRLTPGRLPAAPTVFFSSSDQLRAQDGADPVGEQGHLVGDVAELRLLGGHHAEHRAAADRGDQQVPVLQVDDDLVEARRGRSCRRRRPPGW